MSIVYSINQPFPINIKKYKKNNNKKMNACDLAFTQYDQMCEMAQNSRHPNSIPSSSKKILVRGNTAYFVHKRGRWYMASYFTNHPPIVSRVPADWIIWLKKNAL